MFDEPFWKEIGENVFLSRTGILALKKAKGGKTEGWIKKPERNAKSFSYRYRPKKGGPVRRIVCEVLVKEIFSIGLVCDDDWYQSVCAIYEANKQTKFKDTDKSIDILLMAERSEEQAIICHAVETYPTPYGETREPNFWLGF